MLVSNAVSSLLIRVSSIGCQLAIVPIALETIGREAYGVWMISISIATILIALDLGLSNASFNIAAQKINRKAVDLCAFSAARKAGLVSVILILTIATLILYCNISSIIKTNLNSKEVDQILLLICSLSLLNLPFMVFNQKYYARLEAAKITPYLVGGNIAGLICAWIASQTTESNLIFYCGALLPPLLSQAWIAINPRLSENYLSKRLITAPLLIASNRIKKQGNSFLLIQIASVGSFNIDNLIIGSMISTSDAADFSLATRYFSIVALLLTVYLTSLWPIYASVIRECPEKLMNIFWNNLVKTTLFAILCATFLILIEGPFFEIWTQKKINPSIELMVALAILAVTNALIGNISIIQNAMGRLKIQVYVASIMLIINLALSIMLVNSFGIVGPVIGSIISGAITVILYILLWKV